MKARKVLVALLAVVVLASICEARALNPKLGRWLSRDNIRYVQGLTLYEYASSHPPSATDPTGLIAVTACESSKAEDAHFSKRCSDECNYQLFTRYHGNVKQCPLAVTMCEGTTPWCCVCVFIADDQYPDCGSAVTDCLAEHELVHCGQGCPRPPDGSMKQACQEAQGYTQEWACLNARLGACDGMPDAEKCRADILRRMDAVLTIRDRLQQRCDTEL